jgi:hypothetical protein
MRNDKIINNKNNKMEQTTISLQGTETKVDVNAAYLIDFSKLTSVNDLVLILSCMGFTFAGSHPYIDQIKQFLNLDNPIYPGGKMPEPKSSDLKLPKLKTLSKDGE